MINVVNPQQQTYHLGMVVCEIWPTTLRTYNVIELDVSWNIMKPFPTDTQFFLRVYAGLVMMVQHQIISFRCPQKTFSDRGGVVWKLGYIHWWIIIKLAMFLGWIIHMPDITVSYSNAQLDTPIKCVAADLVRREAPHWSSLQGFYCAEGRGFVFGFLARLVRAEVKLETFTESVDLCRIHHILSRHSLECDSSDSWSWSGP